LNSEFSRKISIPQKKNAIGFVIRLMN